MKTVVYKSNDIPQEVYTTVSNLLHESFAERRFQGINFRCGLFSPQDVENEFVNGGYLLLAIDDSDKVIGILSLIERNKGLFRYASHDNLAVSNAFKGKGVASCLFKKALNIAYENNWDFLISFTATTADSSVRYHLKMGFVIYGKSYGRNYDSYSFIYPLKRLRFVRNKFMCKLIYSFTTSIGILKRKLNR